MELHSIHIEIYGEDDIQGIVDAVRRQSTVDPVPLWFRDTRKIHAPGKHAVIQESGYEEMVPLNLSM